MDQRGGLAGTSELRGAGPQLLAGVYWLTSSGSHPAVSCLASELWGSDCRALSAGRPSSAQGLAATLPPDSSPTASCLLVPKLLPPPGHRAKQGAAR